MSLGYESFEAKNRQNKTFVFRWDETADSARRRIERICGLDRETVRKNERRELQGRRGLKETERHDETEQHVETERHDEMERHVETEWHDETERRRQIAEADRVGRRVYSGSAIRAVTAFFPGSRIQGSVLKLGQARFHCQAFDFYPPDQILGGWVYLLALTGEKNTRLTGETEPSLSENFYRDAWATALTETGRELLQRRLAAEAPQGKVSGSFGPGYYGMEADQLPVFFQALDGNRIGAGLSPGGALTPAKSCAGFYLWLTQRAAPMPDSCKSCQGIPSGCGFCMKKREEQ